MVNLLKSVNRYLPERIGEVYIIPLPLLTTVFVMRASKRIMTLKLCSVGSFTPQCIYWCLTFKPIKRLVLGVNKLLAIVTSNFSTDITITSSHVTGRELTFMLFPSDP